MSQAKYYILLLVVCLIWGATPAFGKFAVESFSPLMITGTRFLLMAIPLFAVMLILRDTKGLKPGKEVLMITFALGFMGVLVHNGLLFLGLKHTTATNTALIESIGPTATTLLAFFFLGERLNRYGWLGIMVSCFGAMCIISKGSIDVILNLSFNIGDIYIVICEVAWSAYCVMGRNISNKVSSIAITAWSGLFGSMLCYLTGLITCTLEVYTVTSEAIWGFAYLVIFSGLLAFIGWNYAVGKVGASKAGVFIYLVPLTGGILGVTILGEEILPAQILGAAFIIGGVVVTVKSKMVMRVQEKTPEQIELESEVNLLKRFPELAEEHNNALVEKGVITHEQNTFRRNEDGSSKADTASAAPADAAPAANQVAAADSAAAAQAPAAAPAPANAAAQTAAEPATATATDGADATPHQPLKS
ncbi:DMT family transporter [Anaerobiospirillum sp. NML120449]|uniref:DMT family transporter n=1 Tax=Anaerobiospirillum sp. NML120449 TaxID=2932817 RepID=UPI001FF1ED76|nr:DMT family transporter [Anaerobiospirillum sp. NML120449]MCK0527020.1 DMT family transporter [Anaerobiospirillum sp. NML120449]